MTPRDSAANAPLLLLAWLSPAFPVGAYAYSHGLEAAADAGRVADAATLACWLDDLVGHGSARSDAVLAAESFRLAATPDERSLVAVNDLALALAPTRERRLETAATGRAFADAIRASWPGAACRALPPAGDLAYPVAFGATVATAALPLAASLQALALGFVGNLVSAATRLGVIGQTDAQRVVAALLPAAERLGTWAATSTLDELGSCALVSDVSAMHHETLYSRLFRS